jgi:hypothetical protein
MTSIVSAPTTDIEIISAAISLCGKQQTVNTIDGGGALAADGQKLYGLLVSAELSSNRWRFAQAFQQSGILTTLTPNFDGWNYYLQLPADSLMVQAVYPYVDYIVFGDKILTRSNQAITVVYAKNVPVSKWPGAFSMYITYHLASLIGTSVSNSDRLLARLAKGLTMWESRALFADAQSTKTQPLRSNPYIDVRHGTRSRRN